MKNPKIFYRRESSARETYGNDYLPVTAISPTGKEVQMFCDARFMNRLLTESRTESVENTGNREFRLIRPDTWAIFTIIKISEDGKTPVLRLYESSPEVSSLRMAREDFKNMVKEHGTVVEPEDDEVPVPGM